MARQIGRQFERRREHDQGAGALAVAVGDLLDQPQVDRVVEERMGVAQQVDAGVAMLDDVAQRRLQFVGVVDDVGAALRFAERRAMIADRAEAVVGEVHVVAEVLARQAVGDAPDEKAEFVGTRRLFDQLANLGLFVRFDDDQRKARAQREPQVVEIVHENPPCARRILSEGLPLSRQSIHG